MMHIKTPILLFVRHTLASATEKKKLYEISSPYRHIPASTSTQSYMTWQMWVALYNIELNVII